MKYLYIFLAGCVATTGIIVWIFSIFWLAIYYPTTSIILTITSFGLATMIGCYLIDEKYKVK